MSMPQVQTRRFTRAEYDTLIAQGFFDEDERIELLDGLLVVKEPRGAWHVQTVSHVRRVLQRAFGDHYDVLVQSPVALDDMCEPEPDLVVVPGRPRDHLDQLPSSPVLVVEVADSSLRKDREPARVGGRWKYSNVKVLRRGATVLPLAAPRARIRVADLLP